MWHILEYFGRGRIVSELGFSLLITRGGQLMTPVSDGEIKIGNKMCEALAPAPRHY